MLFIIMRVIFINFYSIRIIILLSIKHDIEFLYCTFFVLIFSKTYIFISILVLLHSWQTCIKIEILLLFTAFHTYAHKVGWLKLHCHHMARLTLHFTTNHKEEQTLYNRRILVNKWFPQLSTIFLKLNQIKIFLNRQIIF